VYSLSDYRYDLPPERIAQSPAPDRDASRLLILDRETGATGHRRFRDLPDLLRPTDLLVVNNTQVVPARLTGRKESGGRAEVLILDYTGAANNGGPPVHRCLVKASKRARPGSRIRFDDDLEGEIIDFSDGIHTVRFACRGDFEKTLYRIGRMPLPPYIRRDEEADAPCDDGTAYQTVYAARKGAVAAPTAGLHFTPDLLERLKAAGVGIAEITLHVGYGTFLPVRVDDIREHRMHAETYTIPDAAADAVNRAKADNRRIVAVGTTCVRTLEWAADENGRIGSGSGECDLFIYPGYRFRAVDAMITNFHLPESTLLMLVSAFAGRDRVLAAYREAVERGYRFYSYGDAMLIS
jgi:S-adenosylmethionine:tRNA ribosyltransferase-isomerase